MIVESAYAKLNLCLQVGEKLPNGYHSVISLMQTVSLCDTVTLEKAKEISLCCIGQELSDGEDNLAHKAARAFFAHSGIKGGTAIRLEKRIPQGAGLGGGSADAAAVLRGLNRLYGTGYGTDTLCAIAAPLGADVPFCVLGGTAVATGTGTELTAAKQNVLNLVLCFGKESLSTPVMYKTLDSEGNTYTVADKFISLWKAGKAEEAFAYGGNSFYPIAARLDCTVDKNITALKEAGALFCGISGKGPTVFGVFKTAADAIAAAEAAGGIAIHSVS